MFTPVPLYIGLRYTKSKKRDHFISFISLVSMLGIALGVMVLITVLSVMNGFDREIKSRILNLVPEITLSSWQDGLADWQGVRKALLEVPEIRGVAPVINGQGMLGSMDAPAFVVLQGIDPKLDGTVSPIGQKLIEGKLSDLKPGRYGVILGKDLAARLGVIVGDRVTAYLAKSTTSPFGVLPQIRRLVVVGIFDSGFKYDSSYALINIQDAAKLFRLEDRVTDLAIKITDPYQAPAIAAALRQRLPRAFYVSDWTQVNGPLFAALKMQKMVMFLIISLMIAVAAFNMLSSLVMLVIDKRADMAILRTIGASRRCILAIFMTQGCVVGLVGTVGGVLLGLLLSWRVTEIVAWLQRAFGVQILDTQTYYINFLPSHILWQDVALVSLVSLGLSFLSTVYPAWRGSRVEPAQALRYE